MKAHARLTTSAPPPVSVSGMACGATGDENFCKRSPERREPRHEKNAGERHAKPRAVSRVPTERDEDQEVDGGVLEEIDAVGEERNGADAKRDGELDAEIGEVQKRYDENCAAQRPGEFVGHWQSMLPKAV